MTESKITDITSESAHKRRITIEYDNDFGQKSVIYYVELSTEPVTFFMPEGAHNAIIYTNDFSGAEGFGK